MEGGYWNVMLLSCVLKLKDKFYRTTIRLMLLYGSICWAFRKDQSIKIRVAKMRMLDG